MTPSELQQAKALADAASSAPWERRRMPGMSPYEDVLFVVETDDGNQVADCYDNTRWSEQQATANAAFIAASRTLVPALVAEVERLTRERDEAVAELRLYTDALEVPIGDLLKREYAAKAAIADRDSLRALLVEACGLASDGWAYAGDYFRAKWQADARISAILAAAGKVGE